VASRSLPLHYLVAVRHCLLVRQRWPNPAMEAGARSCCCVDIHVDEDLALTDVAVASGSLVTPVAVVEWERERSDSGGAVGGYSPTRRPPHDGVAARAGAGRPACRPTQGGSGPRSSRLLSPPATS